MMVEMNTQNKEDVAHLKFFLNKNSVEILKPSIQQYSCGQNKLEIDFISMIFECIFSKKKLVRRYHIPEARTH